MPSPGQVKRTQLNPILKSALACLDLNLDKELRKYRRACRKQGKVLTPPTHSGGISLPQQSLVDLKSIADFIPLQQPTEEIKHAQAGQKIPHTAAKSVQVNQNQSTSSASNPAESVATLVYQNPKDLTPPPPPEPPTDYLESSEQLLESLYDAPSSSPSPQHQENLDRESVQDLGNATGDDDSGSDSSNGDDLSSEPTWSDDLFTPLGFSAIALAMASGGLLAWSLLVPPPASSSKEMAAIEDSVVITPDAITPVEGTTNLSLGLDLSAPEELVTIDFNNLPNLDPQLSTPIENPVQLPQQLSTTPSNYNASNQGTNNPVVVAPQPLVTVPTPVAPTPPDLLSALLPPELRPQVETQVNGRNVTLPSQGEALYLVVLPYNNDDQLVQVRAVVKQAFVKKLPEGDFIQMAAFDNPKEAQAYGGRLSFGGVKPIVYTLRKQS